MDCPPVSPGGERGPRGSPGTGRGGGAHREPVVKVGSAPGARPGRGEAGRRGSGTGSWRGWGAVPVVLRGSPLRLGRHREHGRGPGLSSPAPFGGKSREVVIDLDPRALAAKGLSPADVVNALQASNVIVPAGTARIGTIEYNVLLNSSPSTVSEFAKIPIKVVGGRPVLLGDVGHVADGYAEQTNIVHVDGKRA